MRAKAEALLVALEAQVCTRIGQTADDIADGTEGYIEDRLALSLARDLLAGRVGGMTKREPRKAMGVSDPKDLEMLRRYRAMPHKQQTAAFALLKGMAEQREPLHVLCLRYLRAIGCDEVSAAKLVETECRKPQQEGTSK